MELAEVPPPPPLSEDDQGAFEDASKVKETTCISSSPLLANSLSTSET
jgi:hypothetical protein